VQDRRAHLGDNGLSTHLELERRGEGAGDEDSGEDGEGGGDVNDDLS